MSRRAVSPRRSAGEWTVRGVLAVVAALLGGLALTHTLAFAIRAAQPDQAHALAPNDARIVALVAEKLSGPQGTTADRIRADGLALGALRDDASIVSAAATLGLNAGIRGNTHQAQQWYNYAERLSRRDLRTQLWMIESAVGRNDIAGALRHYDIALRTSRIAADLLFPVLRSASTNPAIRTALSQTLATKPNWSEPFISQIAGLGDDPKAVAALFEELTRAGGDVPARARALIITRLIDADQISLAWAYYTTIRPGVAKTRSRDTRFAEQLTEPTPFDWRSSDEDGIAVAIQPNGKNSGLVDFSAPSGIGGLLLRQVQVLPPGRYVFEAHGVGIEQPAESRPYWALECVGGQEIGRASLPNSTDARGSVRAIFEVPTSCPTQYLSLNAQPSDAVGGTTGQVDHVSLRPERGEGTS